MKEVSESRKGEQRSIPHRSARYFFLDHHWFATTREGLVLGPYNMLDDCKHMVASFIVFMNNADEGMRKRYLKHMSSKNSEKLPPATRLG